jgi:hypothetical protein
MIGLFLHERAAALIVNSPPGARAFGGQNSTAARTINTVIPSRRAARNPLAL